MAKRLTGIGWAFISVAGMAATVGLDYKFNLSGFYPEPETQTVVNEEGQTVEITVPTPSIQETSSIWKDVDGRDYMIWEVHVVEEPDNSLENGGRINVSFDADIYNFDLGIIYHGSWSEGNADGITRTTFNELADANGNLPPHIERVRQIGCDIAQEHFNRGETEEYAAAPDDVIAYHERHCEID